VFSFIFFKETYFVLTWFTPFSNGQSVVCTHPVFVCFSAQVGRTHTHLSCASLPHSTQTESQDHRSPITSLPCYFIVLYGSFVRLGVQRCWVNLMLIEPQHKLRVKLTELTVFNEEELKRFCTSILVLLPFFVLFLFLTMIDC